MKNKKAINGNVPKQFQNFPGKSTPLNPEKRAEFITFLNDSALDEKHKIDLQFLLEYLEGKHDPLMSSRSYLFTGDVGVGKTYFTSRLIEALSRETIYIASTNLPLLGARRCHSFEEMAQLLQGNEEQVVFLDDLNCIFDRDDCNGISPKSARDFLSILDSVNAQSQKILIATINQRDDLDERMLDRIGVKIDFDLPSVIHKKAFLNGQFKEFLTKEQIESLAVNSLGYNYRDLPEMVRLAYRLGSGKVTSYSLTRALQSYHPNQLYGFDVYRGISTTFHDIIGKKDIIGQLQKCISLRKNQDLLDTLHLQRQNLLLFYGPPGTGKTFLVKALAGQLGFPLINIKGNHLRGNREFDKVERVVNLAKRYHNCVVFIDEAEKIFGNERFGSDNPLIGEFNRALESVDGKGVRAIFILAVNDLSRFGEAFRDRFVFMPFNLPSYEERYAFCSEKALQGGIEIDIEYLARISEGMSFREMERTWSDLLYHYLENKNKLTAGIISSIVKPMKETETIFG